MFAKTNKRPISGLRHDQAGMMPSIIGPDMVIRGDFKSGGELHVSGTVEGNIDVKGLTVAKDATIRGEIAAEQVRLCGAVTRDIRAHEVVLTASARVQGDVSHDVLSIEPGATLEGRCRRREDAAGAAPAALPGAGRTASMIRAIERPPPIPSTS